MKFTNIVHAMLGGLLARESAVARGEDGDVVICNDPRVGPVYVERGNESARCPECGATKVCECDETTEINWNMPHHREDDTVVPE